MSYDDSDELRGGLGDWNKYLPFVHQGLCGLYYLIFTVFWEVRIITTIFIAKKTESPRSYLPWGAAVFKPPDLLDTQVHINLNNHIRAEGDCGRGGSRVCSAWGSGKQLL